MSGKVLSRSAGQQISVGGLVGRSPGDGGLIQNSFFAASADASQAASGFAGSLAGFGDGQILSSGASGSASGVYAGGLVGEFDSIFAIQNSFATGDAFVSAAGGLVGLGSGFVENSYATGKASATQVAGGFIGFASARGIEDSYSTGKVKNADPRKGGGFVGGVNKFYGPAFFTDYWDTTTSGYKKKGVGHDHGAPGPTGLTTTQLQSGLPAGFDPTIWAENPDINNGLPYLIANPPPR